jgi:hypothetical protein
MKLIRIFRCQIDNYSEFKVFILWDTIYGGDGGGFDEKINYFSFILPFSVRERWI